MLNFFRRRDTAVRIVLGGMLVLVCVAMVLFLIPGWGSSSSTPLSSDDVATVDNQAVTGLDLNLALQQQEMGQQLPPQLAPYFAQQILQNLVLRIALADQAQKMGFVATNAQVVQLARQQNPELFPNGRYVGDAEAEPAVDQAYHKTLAEYQGMLRQQVLDQDMYDLVTDGVSVSDAQLRQQFQKQNEKASFDYVLLKPGDLLAQAVVTPQGLEAYYKANLAKYQQPEKRKLEVLLADQSAIAAQTPVGEDEIQQYYQQNLSTYTHPERVQVAHILFKTTGENAAQTAATRAKADAVEKQLKAGGNFADLAKKNSDDDATASKGGEIGWVERGQTVPALEQAAFLLPVGQISPVIQTEYGFEIVKVEAHEQAHIQPLAEVHDQIKQQIQSQMAGDKAQNLINQAEALAMQTPLSQVAKQLGLDYFATGAIGRSDPIAGIGVNPDFATAAFSVASGGVTAPVNVATGYAMAKVVQVIPPAQETLDQAREAVTADYKQQLANQLVVKDAGQLSAAAQKVGLKAAAAAAHLTVKTSAPVTRDGTVPDVGSVSGFADNLFSLKPGQTGPAAAAGDNQVVYSLVALQEPAAADFARQRDALLQNMLDQQRSSLFQAYADSLMATLTKQGKLKFNQTAIERAVGNGSSSGGL